MSSKFIDLPIPDTISREAQSLLNLIKEAGRQPPIQLSLDDVAGWESQIAESDAMMAPIVNQIVESADVIITDEIINGVTVRRVQPRTQPADKREKILINFHGGGYVMLGGELSVMEACVMAAAGEFTVIAVDYRMPPHHPYPAALDDGIAVYRGLLQVGYSGKDIAIFGGSAGGGLTAAVTLALRDSGEPMPAAVYLNTPWSDLSKTGDSYFVNENADPVLFSYDDGLGLMAKLYANGEDLKSPLLSPVYADYSKGFPPTILISGTRDLLLSCTVRMHRALRDQEIQAELHVLEGMWHGFSGIPETMIAQKEAVLFLEKQFDL